MNINVNVKRNFRINGKVYHSIEEMPEDIKETFRKAMASQPDAGGTIDTASVRTKIVFNGTEYDSVETMPENVRQLYDQVMKAAGTAAAPSATTGDGMNPRFETPRHFQGVNHKPAKTESSFSPRALIVSVILVALILMFYYLLRH
jgi:hypothetical protein